MSKKHENEDKIVHRMSTNLAPRRSKLLLQRLSSGLSSILPPLALRRTVSTSSATGKLQTAPDASDDLSSDKVINQSHRVKGRVTKQSVAFFKPEIPNLSVTTQSYPYDSTGYHSFPSVKRRSCNICGLRTSRRSTSGEVSSRPCLDYRSQSPWSLMKPRLPSGMTSRRHVSSLSCEIGSSSSSEEQGARSVASGVAAKECGKASRRAFLPVPRLTAFMSTNIITSRTSASRDGSERPKSPKLHHLHGIPGAKECAYVHRREFDHHLAALRVGAPNSSLQSRQLGSARASTASTNYTETVFYGRTVTPVDIRGSIVDQSQDLCRCATLVLAQLPDNAINVTGCAHQKQAAGHEAELSASDLYQRRSPEHRDGLPQQSNTVLATPQSEFTCDTIGTGATQIVGGQRLELRGGS